MGNRTLVVKSLSFEMKYFNTLSKNEKIKLIGDRKRVLKRRLKRIRDKGLNRFVNDPNIDINLSYQSIDLRRVDVNRYDINRILEDEFKSIVISNNNKTTFLEEIKIIIAIEVGRSFIKQHRIKNGYTNN